MQTAITRFYVHAEFPVSHSNTAGASSQHAWVIIINGHQAALLTAALTREAGAAVTVRTYWAWETAATLRCARRREALLRQQREERGGGISCRHAHSLFYSCIETEYFVQHLCYVFDYDVIFTEYCILIIFNYAFFRCRALYASCHFVMFVYVCWSPC